mmetsp:Transcript_25055/g.34527  ORF Transcript_25055/g.34527 Transcript_25055/m.34527 type:complete len:352 (-) Transcript_25055:123-1178(-)|eukprot:CAMPEP_0196602074 /NCGR_PEP_ID=MMETSP1081-20130531/96238_1 /TAXON_ID=36882 /ORGANISM="Pyramimonas amylifera, Strain CCMP720" /LENGTH=351 /DNA_ID=CAMNT_0041927975 /DNA_START=144 /DNA_END=1199 /DNA_ORIENTATION=-
MFGLAKNLYYYLKKRKDRLLTLVLVGLDNAGKSTLLATLKGESSDKVTPTWGFASENILEGKCKIDIYDLGGGKNIRKIWERYYAEVHGVVYVIDSADTERIAEAKDELHIMLKDSHLSGKPVLIFANKQDLPSALSAAEMASRLELSSIQNTRHQIVLCTAKTKEGSEADPAVKKGLKWLLQQIETDYTKLAQKVDQEAAEQKAEEERKRLERKARVEAQKAERKREEEEKEKGNGSLPLVNPLLNGAMEETKGGMEEGAKEYAGPITENASVLNTLQQPTPPHKTQKLESIPLLRTSMEPLMQTSITSSIQSATTPPRAEKPTSDSLETVLMPGCLQSPTSPIVQNSRC